TLAEDQPVIRAVWPDRGIEDSAPATQERSATPETGWPGLSPRSPGAVREGFTSTNLTEQLMRDLLGRFGLIGDQVYQRVGDLSGGERSRAALARLVALGVNVLVLDEPTNHLDLWACDALEQALMEFKGTLIAVSHDRYFLNRVVDML